MEKSNFSPIVVTGKASSIFLVARDSVKNNLSIHRDKNYSHRPRFFAPAIFCNHCIIAGRLSPFTDGSLYSGTFQMFSGSAPVISRTMGDNPLRTSNSANTLNGKKSRRRKLGVFFVKSVAKNLVMLAPSFAPSREQQPQWFLWRSVAYSYNRIRQWNIW